MRHKKLLTGVTHETFRFIFNHGKTYAGFCGVAVCAFTAVDFLYADSEQTKTFSAGREFYYSALVAVATTFVAVPLHRFIIVNQFSLFPKNVKRATVFATFEFLLSFASLMVLFWVVGGLDLISRFIPTGLFWVSFVLWSAVGVVLLLFSICLSVVLTTLLPHVAVTPMSKFDIRYPVQLSRGFRVSIFLRILSLSILVGIVFALFALSFGSNSFLLQSNEKAIGYYVSLILQNTLSSIIVLIFITLASLIYLRLLGHRQENAPYE